MQSNEWRGSPQLASDGELDLGALGRAVWAKRVLILALTLGAAGLAFLVVSMISPKYKSETRVLIETRDNVFLRPEGDRATEQTQVDPEAVISQVQLIQSRDLAIEVIRQLRLNERPEFDPAIGGGSPLRVLASLFGIGRDPMSMTPEERVLRSYYERLTVFAVDRTRVIAIEFESEDSELAARVANAVADAYLKRQQEAKLTQNRSASQWLAREIDALRGKVAAAEAKVEEFRSGANLFVGNNNTTLSNQQLGDYNAQVATSRATRADAEGKAKLIRETLKSGRAIEFSEIVNSELMRRLTEQRVTMTTQLAEQSSTLLDLHPRIRELRAQIADLERQMREEAERLARTLENESKMATARMDSLVAGLDALKKQAASTNNQDVQLRALDREAKAQRDLLESYLGKYREASARDSLEAASPDARVISRAVISTLPSWPKKLPTIVVAALAVFVLSLGFVLTGELLGGPSYTVTPVVPVRAPARSRFRMPSWGRPRAEPETAVVQRTETPRVEAPPIAPAAAPVAAPAANISPGAIEALARELKSSGEEGRRITIAGARGNIGTTQTAVALARELSRSGSVILIDLALRAPQLATIAADPNAPGVAELVRGTASFGDIITRDQRSGVHLITAGRLPLDASSVAASPRLATTLEALVRSYDHVMIDAGALPEAAVEGLARLAPRAVLVAPDLENPATVAARDRLLRAGYVAVTVLVGMPSGPGAGSTALRAAA